MKKSALLPLAFALGLGGCASLDTLAPPVSPALLRASRGASSGTLENGRLILTTRCAACHRVYPVADYPSAKWKTILAEMAPRAKLDLAQHAAVLAYLNAAHDLPPTPPAH